MVEHTTCGQTSKGVFTCDHCGEELTTRTLRARRGPGYRDTGMLPLDGVGQPSDRAGGDQVDQRLACAAREGERHGDGLAVAHRDPAEEHVRAS